MAVLRASSGQPIQILNLLKILDNVGKLCYLHRYTVNYRKKSGNVLLQFYAVSFIMKFLIFLRPWGKHLKCKACFFHAFYACVLEKLFSREVQNSPDSDGRSVHKLPVKTVQLTCAVFLLFWLTWWMILSKIFLFYRFPQRCVVLNVIFLVWERGFGSSWEDKG